MRTWTLAFAVMGILHAGEAGSAGLSGRITDPSGAVVPGAVVKLTRRAGGEAIALASDRNGQYRTALGAGLYDFAAASPGFAPYARQGVEIREGESRTLDVVLQIPTLSDIVVVTAKAPAGEGALETSSRNSREVLEIREARESAAKDVGEAIANLEGLWKIRKAGIANDVVLRGFQQGNIDVLIDGQRIFAACPGHMDPAASHVDFSEIETVEVTKGPFDVRNQGSLGGTVNIVSRKQDAGYSLTPNFGLSSFGFVNPSLSGSVSKGRFYGVAGYSYRRSDPFVDGLGRTVTGYANYTAAGANNPAFDIHSGWAHLGILLSANQSVDLSYTRQEGGLTLYPALKMDAPYDHADRLSANWSLAGLSGIVKQLRAQTYFTQVKHWMTDELRTGAMGSPTGFSMGTFAGSKAAGGRLEADLADTLVGVEAYNRGWGTVGSMRMGMMTTVQASLPDVRMVVGGFYAQHHRSLGRLSLSFGGRLDAGSSEATNRGLSTDLYWAYHGTRATSQTDVNPSLNARVTYLLPKGIELFGGVGSAVRLPDPEERYYSSRGMGSDWVGNPSLAPVRNTEADLGVNLRRARFSLRPTLFYSMLSDYVAITQQAKLNPVMGLMNSMARSYEGVDARIYGGELSYSVAFSRSLLLAGGVSYTRGIQYAKPAAGLPKGDIAEMPPLKSRASLRYGTSRFFAEVNGLASARQNRVDRRLLEQPTPGFGLLGLKAGVHHRQFNFSGGVDNLLDRFYYEHLSYQRDPFRSGIRLPEPGRTLYLNVSMTLQSKR